jgi:isopentenyl diphosphate isomerase/L-lactate dehydrogenase-like FMN-dependent dehydrogenase
MASPEGTASAADVPEVDAARTRFIVLREIRDAARDQLPRLAWEFLIGGSGDETTLRENEAAFTDWRFRPRVLTGAGKPDLSCEFMGVGLSAPLLTAPFGVDALFHADGQRAVTAAAAAAGVASVVPEAGSFPLEELRTHAPSAARFFQLHPSDPDTVAWLISRAEAAGYEGLFVTADQPVIGWRERNWSNRFVFSSDLVSGNFREVTGPGLDRAFGAIHGGAAPLWDWRQLGAALKRTHLPFAIKGVLTAEDTLSALEIGASAVVVSNHGGRQLHDAPASLRQLPEVVAAAAGRLQVALDSGVRRGSDVVKSLALGADVVLLGRSVAFGLAAAGAAGVYRTLELMVEEIETILALLGCDRLDALGPHVLLPAGLSP